MDHEEEAAYWLPELSAELTTEQAIAAAQVHATLALVAAQDRMSEVLERIEDRCEGISNQLYLSRIGDKR